jgi:hypothetical protein
MGQQIDWFRRRFLRLADKAASTKERGEFLKLAFMATLKGENARGLDDAMAQYAEFRKREDERNEEAHALRDEPSWEPDETGAAILEYFKNTPYRTKDRDAPE